jgi:type III secretion system YscQ/HrcQ family protein
VVASEDILSLSFTRRLRLRYIDSRRARSTSLLFQDRECLVTPGDTELTWRFGYLAGISATNGVVLRGMSEELFIALDTDGLREPLGCREWWDFPPESRLLAWALAHNTLLETLGALFGDAFLPDGWKDSLPPLSVAAVPLSFTVSAADGKSANGEMVLAPEMVTRLAGNAGWRKPQDGLEGWGACLTADLGVTLPAWVDLPGAGVGDVLVLGPRVQCWQRFLLCYRGAPAWRAHYQEGRLEIRGPAITGSPMSEVVALDNIPVTLDFDVGTLAVPLATLAALKPGYVFELPTRLEEARVVIRANGTAIGRGELVAVGDTLGVQLLTIDPNGLR